MLKDYLPIAGILLFVWFWIEDSWAQVVMNFMIAHLGDFIEVINNLIPFVLLLIFVHVFLIPKINSVVFGVWFHLMYRTFNESISLDKNVEDCREFQNDLVDIKRHHETGAPLKKWSTIPSMVYTAINTRSFSVSKK